MRICLSHIGLSNVLSEKFCRHSFAITASVETYVYASIEEEEGQNVRGEANGRGKLVSRRGAILTRLDENKE